MNNNADPKVMCMACARVIQLGQKKNHASTYHKVQSEIGDEVDVQEQQLIQPVIQPVFQRPIIINQRQPLLQYMRKASSFLVDIAVYTWNLIILLIAAIPAVVVMCIMSLIFILISHYWGWIVKLGNLIYAFIYLPVAGKLKEYGLIKGFESEEDIKREFDFATGRAKEYVEQYVGMHTKQIYNEIKAKAIKCGINFEEIEFIKQDKEDKLKKAWVAAIEKESSNFMHVDIVSALLIAFGKTAQACIKAIADDFYECDLIGITNVITKCALEYAGTVSGADANADKANSKPVDSSAESNAADGNK